MKSEKKYSNRSVSDRIDHNVAEKSTGNWTKKGIKRVVIDLDADLVEWYEKLPSRARSFFVRETLKRGIEHDYDIDMDQVKMTLDNVLDEMRSNEDRWRLHSAMFGLLVDYLIRAGAVDAQFLEAMGYEPEDDLSPAS